MESISAVALDLLRNRTIQRPRSNDPARVRKWIEKRLHARRRRRQPAPSAIDLHRAIEAGLSGKSIPTLLAALEITKEDFSDILGRTRKTLNELLQREHLSRTDSDLIYRIARALIHAASTFEDVDYAVQWLKEPNEALGGVQPLSLLATVEGDEVVHAELGAIEHGLPA